METTSLRVCDHEGCENPLDGMRSVARYCSPSCRREANRLKGDGVVNRRWVPGRWVTQKAQGSRKRRSALPKALEVVSPVIAFLDAQKAAQAGVTA